MSSVQGSRVVSVFVPHGPVALEVTDMLKLPMGAKVTLLSTWSLPFGLRYVFAVDCSEVAATGAAQPETAEAKFSRLQKQFFASSLSFDDSMWVRGYLDYCKQEDKVPVTAPDDGILPAEAYRPVPWRFF